MKTEYVVDAHYLLKKYPGKSGWTYAEIPELRPLKENPFGWVKVMGSIDGFVIEHYHMMPLGNGNLFLPVKLEIRKKIKKSAGDYVHVLLNVDNRKYVIPDIIKDAIVLDPICWNVFQALSESAQRKYCKYIMDAKTDNTKTNRIVWLMDKLYNNHKI